MTLKLTFAGFNYVADIDGSYANANSLDSMINDTASNSVALTDDYGINPSTNSIYADYSTATTTGNTETIANLTNTIKAAEANGLTVMVRPLVDFTVDATKAMLKSSDGTHYANGDWRAYYKPTDTTTFFNSYDKTSIAIAIIIVDKGIWLTGRRTILHFAERWKTGRTSHVSRSSACTPLRKPV